MDNALRPHPNSPPQSAPQERHPLDHDAMVDRAIEAEHAAHRTETENVRGLEFSLVSHRRLAQLHLDRIEYLKKQRWTARVDELLDAPPASKE